MSTTLESCPLGETQHPGSPTIKNTALAFIEQGGSEIDDLSPDDISLPRLKLETDAMTAILLNIMKANLFSNQTRDWIVDHVGRKRYSHKEELLEAVGDRAASGLHFLANAILGEIVEDDEGQEITERIDHYRSAYYRRSPNSYREEKNYSQTETLISSGFNTLGTHAPIIIHALEFTGRSKGVEKDKRIEVIKNSGHMAILLSKLDLTDLNRYTNMLNEYHEVIYAMAQMQEASGLTSRFNLRVFQKMRELDDKDWGHFSHRQHTGCVAAVDLDGQGSPLAMSWPWMVEIAEKVGYWLPESENDLVAAS